jgi:hypothetical protein
MERTAYLIGAPKNLELGFGFALAHLSYFEWSRINVGIWVGMLKTVDNKLANGVINKDCS